MEKAKLETAVGVFMLIGLLCVGYLTVKLGNIQMLGPKQYTLEARFNSVAGLKAGAAVEISGVSVGSVSKIWLDHERQVADVRLSIDSNVQITEDVIASIKTAGLIGDKYINLSPGGSDVILKNGEMITDTVSAVDLESLISKYVFGKV